MCWALLPCLFAAYCRLGVSGQVIKPLLRQASAVAFDPVGNLYIADAGAQQVWEATLGGSLLLVAGTGVQGFRGDGGPAAAAELNEPQGLAFGPDGTLYIADTGNQRIRAVSSTGTISTFAGSGAAGFSGDGGPATSAELREPTALALDASGALLVCDTGNARLRRVASGSIATVAGTGVEGFAGDGGPAQQAKLDAPSGLAIGKDGRVWVADTHNQRIRVIDTAGTISTAAGNGRKGFAGDGGPLVSAEFSNPRGLAWDAAGDLLIADEGNQRIRMLTPAGVLSTLAGDGVEGQSVDGAGALMAALRSPRSVASSSFNLPVFADRLNGSVREVTASTGLFQPAALAPGRNTGMTVSVDSSMTYGQSGTAVVTLSGTAGLPAGEVQFGVDAADLGTANLSNGSASLALSQLPAGANYLLATYTGDGLNPQATASLGVQVAALPLIATAASSQVPYGAPLPPLTGAISGLLASDTSAVNVSFVVPGTAHPPVGTYPITAVLSGTAAANYTVSMSAASGSLQVIKAGTSATLGPAGQSFAGIPMSLSASVASATSGQPTGTVQFLDSGTVVASAQLKNGTGTALYTNPTQGAHSLSVQYLGDSNYLPANAVPEVVSVSALPDFTLAVSGSPTASTTAGGAASYTLLVGASSGPFTGAVSLNATGFPSGTAVTFSPPQVVPGSSSAVVTMQVQTPMPQTVSASRRSSGPKDAQEAVAAAAMLLLVTRRKRMQRMWVALLAISFGLCGCGARTVGEGIGGVLSQAYTIAVTGTATNLAGKLVTHSTSLTLTVQQ